MNKLNKNEIDYIKKKIGQKGYSFLDVQYEIIDHVACAIEELRNKENTLSLDVAFDKVHASFGIFGFSALEEGYTNQLQKRYFRQVLKSAEKLLFGSYIIISLCIAVFLYFYISIDFYPESTFMLIYPAVVILYGIEIGRIVKNKKYQKFMSFRIAGGGLGLSCTLPHIGIYLSKVMGKFSPIMGSDIAYFLPAFLLSILVASLYLAHIRQVKQTDELMALYE